MTCGMGRLLVLWLPEPPPGTRVCLSLDGSETGDWTAIKAETVDGLLFTPRRVGSDLPAIWNPADSGGRIPRAEVDATVDRLFDAFDVEIMQCDPPLWETEIDAWALRHDLPKRPRVIRWETYRPKPMHAATERFLVDLRERRLRHDGCPITTTHIRNARMAHRRDGAYMLAKPDAARKIDAAVASVVAHEAAAATRADPDSAWNRASLPPLVFGL